MRHVYEHRESAATVAEKGRQDVFSKLHPKVVGEKIKKLLNENIPNRFLPAGPASKD
jgi:hypothetical protein